LWEGLPDAVLTGREELGFPKLFADIPEPAIDRQRGSAGGKASWFDHTFCQIGLTGLRAAPGERKLPGGGGPHMWFKYMPRTGTSGGLGADIAYVTTSQAEPGSGASPSPINFGDATFSRWKAEAGSVV
jgi:hypothetical protein